ncbi:MAG TPA: HicB family protein [Micromonosporaceae bacterium]|nr:HicB family protein [Micromonosporaceae bacterium]HCU48685.1 HicB family protein [Micromonosporaceae bacterium]
MAHESAYRVVVRRDPEDARFWLADVEGLDGAHTYARSLGALDRYVREVIVLAADLPDEAEDGLTLEWDYHTGDPGLDEEAAQLRRQRETVEAESRRIAEQTAELARRMVAEGRYSVRDAAALLAVSPARVGQVASRRALRRQPRPGRADR